MTSASSTSPELAAPESIDAAVLQFLAGPTVDAPVADRPVASAPTRDELARTVVAGRSFVSAKRIVFVVAMVLALVNCVRFHPDKLPNPPADATFVEVDGVHVRYREAGKKDAPVVVLVHGFGASSDSWLPVIPALSATNRVIAIDLKGFGWSSRPEGDYSPAAQAKLVWRVLDKLGVVEASLVGHSWGTSVVMSMMTAQPARVRRIALYSAYIYDDQVPGFFRWAEKSGLGEVLFGLYYKERIDERAALAYYDERFITQPRIERVKADLAKPGTAAAALAAARGHHFAELHRAIAKTPFGRNAATADGSHTKPVLLLWGNEDQVTPIRFGQRLVAELGNAELKTYARCGHIPMVEAPQSTRDLAAFLAAEPRPVPVPATPAPAPAEPTGGGGADGGGGGGTGGGVSDDDVVGGYSETIIELPNTKPERALPIGADLATLGAELTPRLYASPRDKMELVVHGALRVRDIQLYNLDLDRGLDSTGQPIAPVPLGGGQRVDAMDLRARTDLAFYARGVGVAVKARIDWLDNVGLGGDPDLSNGSPATSGGQNPSTVVIKRAWGEALTPFGTLAVGRMGAHFGLGIAANGGDCEDCDHGDASDRAAFVMPVGGHLLAVAYDIASRGPFTTARDGGSTVSLEPSDKAAGPTLAILKIHSPATLLRREAAGLSSVEYGAYLTRRTQDRDVPASYLPTAGDMAFTEVDLVARGFSTTLTGGWLRVSGPRFRVEGELVYARANLEQPSLIPGAEITTPVTSRQLGAALQSELYAGSAKLGLDAGFASGDDAPGFGAFPKIGDAAPMAGAFDGAQANPPRDTTVDNFRFHPDFHVDQVLFREIIGTVTDAIYLRPHARVGLLAVGNGRLELGAALIASWAVKASSTPSGEKALGIELDPELRYASKDGFAITMNYGLFLPGAGFDNTTLEAKPAQVFRARASFVF